MTDSGDQSVTQWIKRLKVRDQEAARQLWQCYFEKLVYLARKRLGTARRRAEDEEDVALSVLRSLCSGAAKGRFPKLADRDDLWRLLLVITKQKCVDRLRHEAALKRGGGNVRGDSALLPANDDSAIGFDLVLDDGPTPDFVVQLTEQLELLMQQLRDETLRQVALSKMYGYKNAEIADRLGITTRSVERKLRLIREKWAKELDV